MMNRMLPAPLNFDYLGNRRNLGYLKGINSVPCPKCYTTGTIDYPIKGYVSLSGEFLCPKCGGYGDVGVARP